MVEVSFSWCSICSTMPSKGFEKWRSLASTTMWQTITLCKLYKLYGNTYKYAKNYSHTVWQLTLIPSIGYMTNHRMYSIHEHFISSPFAWWVVLYVCREWRSYLSTAVPHVCPSTFTNTPAPTFRHLRARTAVPRNVFKWAVLCSTECRIVFWLHPFIQF